MHEISKVCHLHEVIPLYFLVATAFGEQNAISGITEYSALNSGVSLPADFCRHGLFPSIHLSCFGIIFHANGTEAKSVPA